jgi:hypothetical protein
VWLQCETAANCFQIAELLDCQGLLTDRNRKSRVPRPVSFVPRCGRYRQAVAGGCEPERRSCTLANWDRRDTTQCFGPCPTLTGYLQAVTRCSEPDRRSRALANWNCRRMPRCRDSYYTMAVCTHQPTESAAEDRNRFDLRCRLGSCGTVAIYRHQKIVKMPYSNPAATHWRTTRVTVPFVACCAVSSASKEEPHSQRRRAMPR